MLFLDGNNKYHYSKFYATAPGTTVTLYLGAYFLELLLCLGKCFVWGVGSGVLLTLYLLTWRI